MIFGVGPFPRMEVAGAAAATVLAQAIVTAMFLLAARRETILFPHIHPFRPSQRRTWLELLRIGLPVSIQSMFFSSLSMLIARIVAGWGDAAIAAQKVGTQIESISYTTAEGFATAVNAFIAQNFGARRLDRIRRGYWTAVGMIVAWSCLTTVMLVVFPAPLVRVFIQEEEVVRTGVSYLRIMGYSQILMCLEITSSGAFQGLGRPMPPTLAGVIGNAARIPMAILLSATVLGLDGVWWSISISSIAKGPFGARRPRGKPRISPRSIRLKRHTRIRCGRRRAVIIPRPRMVGQSGCAPARQQEWYRRGFPAFVSYGRQGPFIFCNIKCHVYNGGNTWSTKRR